MDQVITALEVAVLVALVSVVIILVRGRRPRTDDRFAASTEGSKRCPRCGMGNLWTDRTCINCGETLPG